jgi:hypothetical protein
LTTDVFLVCFTLWYSIQGNDITFISQACLAAVPPDSSVSGDATPEISKLLDTAKEDQTVFRWTKAEKVRGDIRTAFGEMGKTQPLDTAENAYRVLLLCMDSSGKFDPEKPLSISPPTKPKLLYSDLNVDNAGQFCNDAAAAAASVIWNIFKSAPLLPRIFATIKYEKLQRPF